MKMLPKPAISFLLVCCFSGAACAGGPACTRPPPPLGCRACLRAGHVPQASQALIDLLTQGQGISLLIKLLKACLLLRRQDAESLDALVGGAQRLHLLRGIQA